MNVLRTALFFILAMAAHWLLASRFSFWGLSPQLLLVLTVAVASRQGPVRAMCLGFGWGLFLDVLSARLFGANALALTLAGYGAASVRRQVDVAGLAPQCVVVFFMTWGYFLFLGVLGAVFLKRFLWVGGTSFLLDSFYNCLVAVFVYAFWSRRKER